MTVVSVLPAPDTHTPRKYRYIHIKLTEHKLNESFEFFKTDYSFWTGTVKNMMNVSMAHEFAALRSDEVEALKRTESFDLLAFGWHYNDYQLGLAAHFNCPAVILSTTPSTYAGIRKLVGNPASVSTVAYDLDVLTGTTGGMSFSQRFWNVKQHVYDNIFNWWIQKWVYEPYYKYNFPRDQYPSFVEIRGNVSLVLVSSHFTEAQPVPLLPAIIEVGGMHISRIVRALPADIKDFLDNASEHGVVVCSFDDGLKSSEMAPYIVETFANVFEAMQQSVLWKWDQSNEMPKRLSDNVMMVKWLPLTDVLNHTNVKGLITNRGKVGVTEAMYYGVPILAIEFGVGASTAVYSTIRGGYGLTVNSLYLEEDTLTRAIYKVIKSPHIRQAARAISTRYRDRPMHPIETAMFWVEYVLRHQGAPHMQSPGVHMNALQYHLVDVLILYAQVICAVVIICVGIIWFGLWSSIKLLNSLIVRLFYGFCKKILDSFRAKLKSLIAIWNGDEPKPIAIQSKKPKRQLDKEPKPIAKKLKKKTKAPTG